MYKKHGQLYFSPSDLTRYMESPFASWMDRFAIECPEQAPEKDLDDPLLASLSQKGFDHENAVRAAFVEKGLSLETINDGSNKEKYEKTLAAIEKGVDVIAQARLELESFGGYADFLVKEFPCDGGSPNHSRDYHYEVWDAKLSSTPKPTFVIQLCCYAEMLEVVQGCRPEFITIALGNGKKERLRTNDFYYYYQTLKSSFLNERKCFNPTDRPDPADSKSWLDWSSYAEQLLLEKDHLFQVATITRGQIKKFNQASITTMQELANSTPGHIPGINPVVSGRLKSQAALQKKSVGRDKPRFEIIVPAEGEKSGLALLPPHSSLDVFFDIEGYPFDQGGLEYLWGVTWFNEQGDQKFTDFWAHNCEQEKTTFQSFIEWVYDRWQQDPSMHIYHYAHYEITACRKLMGRYGVCEYEVDQLLRNEVFVDLFKIIKGSLLLGEPGYSLKNVERLYRDKRESEVGSGGDSMVVYEQWRELNQKGAQGDTWQTSEILKNIRDYNIDDCNSTQELAEWLRQQQKSHDILFLGKTDVTEPEIKEEITKRIQLRDRLLTRAHTERESNPEQAALTENLAWTLEFHRREAKPLFWRLFDRLGLSPEELMDDPDCLACCERTEREAFRPTPRARNLAYEYRFDPGQEFRGVQQSFYLLGVETEDGNTAKATFVKDQSNLGKGLIMLQSKTEPPAIISLIPDEYVNPNPIPQSIFQFVSDYENGISNVGQSAILDFLMRSKPGIKGHPEGPIAASRDPEERLRQTIHAVRRLDNSYLAIQGPPGAGKTYTGKHAIAELVKSGTCVGISSNSHRAINNLLLSTARHCKEEGIPATFACTKDTEPGLAEFGVKIMKNNELTGYVKPGCVIGTTAWGFSRDDMVNQFDYLFVDEAGQVAVANLIAMSRSARNLILLGDQMQLRQPSQGVHPADSGLSALDYLLHETPTVAEDMGIFLGLTYRMHSKVNRFISKHIYEGKLKSHRDNDKRIIEVPAGYSGPLDVDSGLVFVPVRHEGNAQASDEEVAEIKRLANDLIGRTFHTGDDNLPTRPIGWNDMLFVAPYNQQVNKLSIALGGKAKVGSVDKFQGQEAPIVFLSMCSSDASESPRGLNFLFNKNRINVAISRGQSLAVVTGNPNIGKTPVNQVDQLKLVNLFNAITNG